MRLKVVRAAGAEGCPGPDYFDNRLTTLLGGKRRLFSNDALARLVVTLAPDPAQKAYLGRAELFDEDGTRRYQRELGPLRDCQILTDALAVAFATHWEELTGHRRKAPDDGDTAPPPPSAQPPPSAPAARPPPPAAASVPAPSPAPRPSSPPVWPPVCKLFLGGYCVLVDIYSFGLTAGVLMTANYTADVGPGAYVGAEIRPTERFSFELQLRGIFPARVVASEPIWPDRPYETPKEPDVSNVAMLLVPCYRYSYFMGCVVGQFGITVFNTPSVATTGQSIALGPRLGIEIPFLERFAVRAWGDAIFHIPPVTYGLEDVNLKWTESTVAALFGAGFVVNFK